MTLLDEMWRGDRCHWVIDPKTRQGRSRICHWFEGDCPYCKAGQREIWLGFIAVYNHAASRRDVFRAGPEGAKQVARFAGPHGGLRGVRLKIRTATAGVNSSLDVKESAGGLLLPLPHPHAIEPTICLVLGCNRLPEYRYSAAEIIGPVDSDERGGV